MVFVYQKMSTLSKTFAAPFSQKLYDSDSNVASVRRECVCVCWRRERGRRSKYVWLTRAERREVRHTLAADQTVPSDTTNSVRVKDERERERERVEKDKDTSMTTLTLTLALIRLNRHIPS